MKQTIVLLVVGLSQRLLGEHTPHLSALVKRGAMRPLRTITPAVTCSVQSTFVTGKLPSDHGIVANGWYFRDLAEVSFWRQSNRLVQVDKVWDAAKKRDPDFTCAKLFWWYNMYSSADWSVTPRPMYPADGRKIPDVYAAPSELRNELQQKLGQFPLFKFWGPMADISSSDWITRSALHVLKTRSPTLSLVYLPHLDYNLQRLGPSHPKLAADLEQIDALCGELIEEADKKGARIVVLSEYGITDVTGPVHINRILRQAGLLQVREELGREILDAGASQAFAVADHQLAHVYVQRPELIAQVQSLLLESDGIADVLDEAGKQAHGLDHPRSGELVALSKPDRWFSYYFWLDDERAPDYARTVDIHRKPGYDPVELFLDPQLLAPRLKAFGKVGLRKLGFRNLLNVIGLDASLVKGSHGLVTEGPDAPVFITSEPDLLLGKDQAGGPSEDAVQATQVRGLLLSHLFD